MRASLMNTNGSTIQQWSNRNRRQWWMRRKLRTNPISMFSQSILEPQQRWLPDKAWAGEYLAFNVVLKELPLVKIFITSLQPTWFVFYNTKPSELFHVFSINLRNGSPDKGWGKRIFGAWKDQPTRLEQSIWDSVGWAIDIMGTIRDNLEYISVFVYLYIFVFVYCQFFVFRNVGGYWLRIP